jgi:hypothetical protein
MGFMDKVKAAAQDVATEAKKAKDQAATKMEQSSLRKKQDEHARELGWLIYRERTENTPAGTEADRLISEITSLQGQLDAQAAAATEPGSAAVATPEGDGAPAHTDASTQEPPAEGTTPPGSSTS